MKQLIKEQLEVKDTSVNDPNIRFNSSLYHPTDLTNYNLKEQLEELIGPTDFKSNLEKVNLSIGIIISAMLLIFFLL
jgi:hypothetical protein